MSEIKNEKELSNFDFEILQEGEKRSIEGGQLKLKSMVTGTPATDDKQIPPPSSLPTACDALS